MISLDQLREDLKDVKYYYLRKKVFDKTVESIGITQMQLKVIRYNEAALLASPRLYDLYIGLYVMGHTQFSYAMEMGYTERYIQMQNKQLLLFLQKNLKED